ncbi:MAG: glutamate--tRNA ligase [Bacteriovoracia bacterium]
MSEVRVRFAPSPTGYLHVGGARTVLFNWLYARHTAGKLILRIEDTDQARSTPEHERMQIEDMKWLGLNWDEGPDVGGPHAPYRQSERREIYKKYAKELMDSDRAYHCFCSDELLTQKREAAMKLGTVPQYDGTCRKLSKAEIEKKLQAGEKATVRFKAPLRDYKIQDAVRGEVVFPQNMVGDFIILRNDGMPVYNFCCVIDDHLMNITHVLRAEEHLSNTVRQLMLFETFGWKVPTFAHCSLILGSDRTKLSKRHGATSVHQYAEDGYLPDALLNFLVLLGWSSPDHKEILTIQEMINNFDLDRLNKAPCVFDTVKLNWMNGEYIKNMPVETLREKVEPYLEKAGLSVKTLDKQWVHQALETIRGHLHLLSDAPKFMAIYFGDKVTLEDDAKKLVGEETFKKVISVFREKIKNHLDSKGDQLTAEAFQAIETSVKTDTQAKGKGLFMPLRISLTGQTHGPELRLVAPLLGATRALSRIDSVLEG